MKQNDTPAGEEQLILALAAGDTVREAARQAGLSERTAYRRLADAGFRGAVDQARDQMFDAVRGQLAGLASRAVETLERLMKSDNPSVALGAAKAALELGPRLREATRLEEQINRLEDDDLAGQTAGANQTAEGNQTTVGHEELVLALAAGASVLGAAQRAGVEEATARGRLADADFQRAVSRARGRLLHTVLGRLAKLASGASGVLERLMDSDQPSVARRAAKTVLQLGPRLRESELDERLSRLAAKDEGADERRTPQGHCGTAA